MGRPPTPWWWEDEQGWYVNLQGKRRFLGKHPADSARPKKSKKGRWNAPEAIQKAFRAMLDDRPPETAAAPPTADAVVHVLDDFILWCSQNRAKITTTRYQQFCS